MNTGIIASRYAKAFLKYVQENGAGNDVYSQACVLVRHMNELPRLKEYIQDASDVSFERKLALMWSLISTSARPVPRSVAGTIGLMNVAQLRQTTIATAIGSALTPNA